MLPSIVIVNIFIIATAFTISVATESIFSGGLKNIGNFREILEELLTFGHTISGVHNKPSLHTASLIYSDVDYFTFIALNMWRVLMITIEISTCVYAYKRAIQFEGVDVKSPDRELSVSTLESIRSTTSKILGNFKVESTNEETVIEKKIVLWLRSNENDAGTKELLAELEKNYSEQIIVNQFFSEKVIMKFLKVLFSVKPTLATAKGAENLKVVLECADAESFEELVWFLRDAGASVPLMVFRLPGFDDTKVLTRLKAKYHPIETTDILQDVSFFITNKF